ncbi:unnamed protein product, partial [Ectocarpus sp. 8 AP-2014]
MDGRRVVGVVIAFFSCVKCLVGGLRRRKERGQEYLFQQPPTEGCSIEKGETFIRRWSISLQLPWTAASP